MRVFERSYGAARFGRPTILPETAVARPSLLSGSTSSRSSLRTNGKGKDGFAVCALDAALKDEVCRAADQTGVSEKVGLPHRNSVGPSRPWLSSSWV